MKVITQLLALTAIQASTAFVVQNSKSSSVLKAFEGSFDRNEAAREPLSRESVSTGDLGRRGSYGEMRRNRPGRIGYGGGYPYSSRTPLDRESISALPRSRRTLDNQFSTTVQGGSLRTWAFNTAERVQVELDTEGRPLDADIELWNGPDNTPQKMKVYVEDGSVRPFTCVIETPRGPNTVGVRNIGYLEFPMEARVMGGSSNDFPMTFNADPIIIQGGALRTFSYEPVVDSVQVLLTTDGRPLNARIELLQGPNNNKQVIELYSEDGIDRPFYAILPTPGSGNVVRVVNTSPMEFPLTATVEPFEIGTLDFGVEEGLMIGGM